MSLKGAKVEKFRQRLLAKRKELLNGVRGSNVKSLESTGEEIQDIADQASSAYTKEFLLSIGDTERRMLQSGGRGALQDPPGEIRPVRGMRRDDRRAPARGVALRQAVHRLSGGGRAGQGRAVISVRRRRYASPGGLSPLPARCAPVSAGSVVADLSSSMRPSSPRRWVALVYASASRLPVSRPPARSAFAWAGLRTLAILCLLSVLVGGALAPSLVSAQAQEQGPADADTMRERLAAGQRLVRDLAARPATGPIVLGLLVLWIVWWVPRLLRHGGSGAPNRGMARRLARRGHYLEAGPSLRAIGGLGGRRRRLRARASLPGGGEDLGAPESAGQGGPAVRAGQ